MTNEELYEQLGDSAKKWVKEQEKIIDRKLFNWFIYLAIGLSVPIMAYFLKPDIESMATWIQRSGSIMVVFSLLAEIKTKLIERIAIVRDHTFLYCNMYLKGKYERRIRIINILTYLSIVVGTIIWGYGDILISYIATWNS